MKYYIEITLLDEQEENLFKLWSRLFTQIHLGLVEIQDQEKQSPIGISFPEYFMGEKFGVLGSKLRLFANEKLELIKFDAKKWLDRLSDYVHLSGIREVPQKIDGYAIYNRYQPKGNKEKLARRYAKRHQMDYDEALKLYEKSPDKSTTKPFIRLKSLSNKQIFSLWIQKFATSEANYQKFSTYGLSDYDKEKLHLKKFSTVPEF